MSKILLLLTCMSLPWMMKGTELDPEGLWVITSVTAGDQIMTPNGRWIRFNADNTQESGNGWVQHSVGTWQYDEEQYTLTIVNENGLKDPNGAFKVSTKGEQMIWTRMEDGMKIHVTLERADKLPMTYGDGLLGVWLLTASSGEGQYFNELEAFPDEQYLFFRWDRKFVIGNGEERMMGVYNVHGHKPQLEMIPYADLHDRDSWRFETIGDTLRIKQMGMDDKITRTFIRTHTFPE